MKRFHLELCQDVIGEASIMKLCSHDKVLKLYGITTTLDWIVMEWFYAWTLSNYMQIYAENKLNLNQMINIAAQVN